MKEKHYIDALAEYAKRLGAFCKWELCELPESRLGDQPGEKEILAALDREAREIEKAIPAGAFVTALCVEGKELSSPELARLLADCALEGKSRLCFLVGGSFGLHDRVKAAADLRLSMSRMTFPHHLARVMLAEQLYRGFTINEGSRYHK